MKSTLHLFLPLLFLASVEFTLPGNPIVVGQSLLVDIARLPEQNVEAQKTQRITTLELNTSIERELSGGQKHTFVTALAELQYAALLVEQRSIDVVVRVFDTEQKLIFEFDYEIRNEGTEKVQLVAKTAGNYRVEVEAKFRNAPAGLYQIHLVELRPATEEDRSLHEARVLLTESLSLSRAGKYKDALSIATRALEIREKILGPEHPEVAILLNRIGIVNFSLGEISTAEPLFKRALDILEKHLGPDHLIVTETLNNLSVLYRNRGDFVEAERILRRILAVREKELGPDHPAVAITLSNLGILYRRRGDNAKAEVMYDRSLDIRERSLGVDHPDLVPVLTNLAALNYYKGDYGRALSFDQRVLDIQGKNLKEGHPRIADALTNLAIVYADSGQPEKAEPLYYRALEIYEKNFGRDHIASLRALNNLGKLYQERGEYDKAESYLNRCLKAAEKNLGTDHMDVASYVFNLGGLYLLIGDYPKAEPLLTRALEMREKLLGVDHYDVGRSYSALARLFTFKGEVPKAVDLQTRANKIIEKHIALNLAIGTEHQKLKYMSLLSEDLNQTIALHASLARENVHALEQAATAILQRKGRVLVALTESMATLRERLEPRVGDLFERLNDANARLAELTLNAPPRGMNLDEYQRQITVVQEQKESIEVQLSRLSAGFYQSAKPLTLEAVRRLVPSDAALVEIAVYRPFNVKTALNRTVFGEPRYVAYVIRHKGDVQWTELGPVKEIDSRVEAWRKALRDLRRKDVRQLARAVDQKIMQPVRGLVGDATHLLISPDGELNLIPFEALVNEQGDYLVRRYAFTYLTSGRDLLRTRAGRKSQSQPVIVAAPLFSEPATHQTSRANVVENQAAARYRRRSVTTARNLSDVYFAPLSGTAYEARAIQKLFPEAQLLLGAEATKRALKKTTGPSILHIATHGFFLEKARATAGPQDGLTLNEFDRRVENPLLRSGLALAGANARRGGGDDGILTALEASGLNLWGTDLVVLSACDTGLGVVRTGEGVYGLRRSFMLAGAESVVMSLWPVSDYSTRTLMTMFYGNLKQGMGRGAALRQVQLDLLKRNSKLHPFYWANFIQSGNWTNLPEVTKN